MLHFQDELVRTNFKFEAPFFDSSHTNNLLYIIYQSVMEMLTYFHSMSLNEDCGCMIFSVAYQYRKFMSIIERVIIYIYIEFFASYFCDPSHCLAKFTGCQVGDNRRTVNTSRSPHISDQLGTENLRETVMLIYLSAMSSGLQKYVSI